MHPNFLEDLDLVNYPGQNKSNVSTDELYHIKVGAPCHIRLNVIQSNLFVPLNALIFVVPYITTLIKHIT